MRAAFVLYQLILGLSLLSLPWSRFWQENWFIWHSHGQLRVLLLSGVARGAISGLGAAILLQALGWTYAEAAARPAPADEGHAHGEPQAPPGKPEALRGEEESGRDGKGADRSPAGGAAEGAPGEGTSGAADRDAPGSYRSAPGENAPGADRDGHDADENDAGIIEKTIDRVGDEN